LTPRALAAELLASESNVAAALAELGALGLVGYDLAEGAYFHRELPFDVSRIERLHPRLARARGLARAGAGAVDAEGALGRAAATPIITSAATTMANGVARVRGQAVTAHRAAPASTSWRRVSRPG